MPFDCGTPLVFFYEFFFYTLRLLITILTLCCNSGLTNEPLDEKTFLHICENRAADQRLCFRFIASTVHPKIQASS